jgi:8-oxo-dGTP pyrophosphatase MutT (NUDIX family)
MTDVLALLDEVRSIARTGLHFTESPYDRERYERLLEIAASAYADLVRLPEGVVLERFRAELGYVTTKVGADGAVIDDDERVLVARRSDDGTWGLVAGWVDSGEAPHETIVREFREETGYEIVVDALVGVIARPAGAEHGPHSNISVVFLCTIVGGELQLSHEVLEVAWRHVDDVEEWHKNHRDLACAALAYWREARGDSTA